MSFLFFILLYFFFLFYSLSLSFFLFIQHLLNTRSPLDTEQVRKLCTHLSFRDLFCHCTHLRVLWGPPCTCFQIQSFHGNDMDTLTLIKTSYSKDFMWFFSFGYFKNEDAPLKTEIFSNLQNIKGNICIHQLLNPGLHKWFRKIEANMLVKWLIKLCLEKLYLNESYLWQSRSLSKWREMLVVII